MHNLHGQFSCFHFLILILKVSNFVWFYSHQVVYPEFLGQGKKYSLSRDILILPRIWKITKFAWSYNDSLFSLKTLLIAGGDRLLTSLYISVASYLKCTNLYIYLLTFLIKFLVVSSQDDVWHTDITIFAFDWTR